MPQISLSDLSLVLELNDLKYVAYQVETHKVSWPFIRSQRGAPLLIHSNYLYRCERKINKRFYWLCLGYKKSKCTARIILEGNALCKITPHNHQADSRAIDTRLVLKNLEDSDIDEWMKSKPDSIK